MSWLGRLQLHYTRDGQRTTALDRHEGPLRVLQRLYPEGPGICHHVLVHPPGGLVGGDILEIKATLEAGSHALITTPAATRFYRSAGAAAVQRTRLHLQAGARLEWLPLETIAYRSCLAENSVHVFLEPTAEAMGWDVLALGLPAAEQPFDSGSVRQHLELDGHWIERGLISASDTVLLQSPLGLAGRSVLATLWFVSGEDIASARLGLLLDAARDCCAGRSHAATAGVTSPNARVVVLRLLAHRVEPAMQLLNIIRAEWRRLAWDLAAEPPRIWRQ